MVRELAGRPSRYERNESYLRWRRIEQIRSSLSADEIVTELTDVLDAIEEFRERFDADSPNVVSLVEASRESAIGGLGGAVDMADARAPRSVARGGSSRRAWDDSSNPC